MSIAVMTAVVMFSSGIAFGKASAQSGSKLRLYFLVDGQIAATSRSIDAGKTPAAAALKALFDGPAVNELAIGLRTALPAGLSTEQPLSLDAKTKTITVGLPSIFTSDSSEVEARRTAQIVYTLTQFPTVESVSFVIDGKPYEPFDGEGKRVDRPVTRADYESLVPAILVESVTAGNPLHVEGTANVFEAQFSFVLYDANNKRIASGPITATSGTGTRGTFSVDIRYDVKSSQTGTFVAFEQSAKDGSTINLVAVLAPLSPACC
jgi:hypothetical protein